MAYSPLVPFLSVGVGFFIVILITVVWATCSKCRKRRQSLLAEDALNINNSENTVYAIERESAVRVREDQQCNTHSLTLTPEQLTPWMSEASSHIVPTTMEHNPEVTSQLPVTHARRQTSTNERLINRCARNGNRNERRPVIVRIRRIFCVRLRTPYQGLNEPEAPPPYGIDSEMPPSYESSERGTYPSRATYDSGINMEPPPPYRERY